MELFECEWKDDRVEVFRILDQKKYVGYYKLITGDICSLCGNPYLFRVNGKMECLEGNLHANLEYVDGTYQLGHYYKKSSLELKDGNDILTAHILNLKKDKVYAEPLAKAIMLLFKNKISFMLEADAIIPIPNHEEDYYGDAKAVALAEELAKQFNLAGKNTEVLHALKKVKPESITHMGKNEREEAVNNMFEFNKDVNLSNKVAILVDDILTAGNIKGKCASILKENGASKVWLFAAGRTK